MNNKITIKAADDKDLPVYIYEPSISRIGAIVLIQEIFG
ncbi:MAG: dienelactone hydrolase family protein, partial [Pelagibacterales bacterium]|nr:dienelactone hydrolase family protein [Pelagibacterales bacterium]